MTNRILSLCCGLMLLSGTSASGGGVNLSWNDCGLAGVEDMAFACNTNTGPPFQLFVSFDPQADMTDFVAAEWAVDFVSDRVLVDPWWQFKGAGRCRDASMTLFSTFAAGPYSCSDPWGGAFITQGFTYEIGVWGPNSARVHGVQALNASAPTAVLAGTEYYAVDLVINRARTVGTDACAGCLDPICMVIWYVDLIGLTSRQRLPWPRDRSFATWHGARSSPPGCPASYPPWVPTLRNTWGRIKSLYR